MINNTRPKGILSIIGALSATVLLLVDCGHRTTSLNSDELQSLRQQNESLSTRINLLEEHLRNIDSILVESKLKTDLHDASINDLEDDLEDVIKYLNKEMNY